eukprot:1961503-Rhodomonas_salina.2
MAASRPHCLHLRPKITRFGGTEFGGGAALRKQHDQKARKVMKDLLIRSGPYAPEPYHAAVVADIP